MDSLTTIRYFDSNVLPVYVWCKFEGEYIPETEI